MVPLQGCQKMKLMAAVGRMKISVFTDTKMLICTKSKAGANRLREV